MPKVSIVVPNYNHGRFLEQRLKSVYLQSFRDFEVILLDDNSTDNSRGWLEKYRKEPQTAAVLYNTRNSGSTFLQWDKGIHAATGDWIWIAESDDFSTPDFLQIASEHFHNGVGMVILGSASVDEAGIPEPGHETPASPVREQNWALSNPVPNASAVVFRKDLWLRYREHVLPYRLNGDWLFWCWIARNTQVAECAEQCNYFRHHAQSARSQHSQSGTNLLEYGHMLWQMWKDGLCSAEELKAGTRMLFREWIARKGRGIGMNIRIYRQGRKLEQVSGERVGFSAPMIMKLI
ncbi:MAG: glycosyltransferase family 2 protein [Flavobacteriales bacterium]|nr:glycosyltransferase family 2 protein [Flavobacteriales bacterium]